MTQKELLYLEDAISHEEIICDICSKMINYLENDDLIKFIELDLKNHTSFKNKLLKKKEELFDE